MPSDVLKLTTEIVISHVSMTELTPEQLVDEIKAVYNVLASLDGGAILEEAVPGKSEEAGMVKQSPIPLKDIVKAKYVVCLECGKKLKTLKTHLRKTHGLMPKEYFQRYGPGPQKVPPGVQRLFRGSQQDGQGPGLRRPERETEGRQIGITGSKDF